MQRPSISQSDLASPSASHAHAITWRSVSLGTLCVIAVNILTPVNDLLLSNMSVAANYVPLASVLIPFLLIVCVNAPLHRWAPRSALQPTELGIIVMMLLVGCGLPNWGFARFFTPMPVVPFYYFSDPQLETIFRSMGVPKWLYPDDAWRGGRFSPVVDRFYQGLQPGESMPWIAWLKPLTTWGVFLVAMFVTIGALFRIILPQWAENERLPFPIVQYHVALLEPPEPGYSFNSLLRSRLLWIAMAAVMIVHGTEVVNAYFPKNMPKIPIGYNFTGFMADPPYSYIRSRVRAASISFIVVGVTYFIRARASLSLWGIYLLVCLYDFVIQIQGRAATGADAWGDTHLGACIAFTLGLIWVGRHHLRMVFRNALRLNDDRTYRVSFWAVVVGFVVMVGWLIVVGVTWWNAIAIVLFVLLAHVIVARVVAEAGLPYFRTGVNPPQLYTNVNPKWITMRDVYFGSVFTVLAADGSRDCLGAMTLTGQGVANDPSLRSSSPPRFRYGLALMIALLIGAAVAVGSTMWMQYHFRTPDFRDTNNQAFGGNNTGAIYFPKRDILDPMRDFSDGSFTPKAHNPAVQMAVGFAIVAALQTASLRFAWWPLLPVGFIASNGNFIELSWFSIFVGWAAKSLIVWLGGASLYKKSQPLFVGLILGEGLAAGIWLMINAFLITAGQPYKNIQFFL